MLTHPPLLVSMSDSSFLDTGKNKKNIPSDSGETCVNGFQFQRQHAILTVLIVWVFGGNLVWVSLDSVPPAYDFARHLYISFLYLQAFDWSSESLWFDLLNVEPFYPPLYHLFLIPFALLFGFSAYSAVLINSIYLGVTILSSYGIGLLIYDRRTGLMAAFLVSCYPFLSYVSRTPMIDTMLTAAVVLAYCLFLKSKNFEERIYSLLFALVFAGGMMVKWTFLVYVLPAVIIGLIGNKPLRLRQYLAQLAYYLGMILVLLVIPLFIFFLEELKWVAWVLEISLGVILVRTISYSNISKAKIVNITILTVTSLVICFPWYSQTFLSLIRGGMKSNSSGIREGDLTAGVDRWIHYVHMLQEQVGGGLFLLFLVGLIICLIRIKHFNALLIGWLVFSYVIFSSLTNHDMRYIMPTLPCIAVISSFWMFRIQYDLFRKILVSTVLLVGVFIFIAPFFWGHQINLKVLGASAFGYTRPPITGQYWPLDRVLNDIIEEAAPNEGETITVRTLTNHRFFQRGGFRNTVLFNNLPIAMKSVKRNVGELTDFFITKEGAGSGLSFWQKDIGPKKKKLLEDPALRKTFPLFKKYLLPDGTYGLVFKRKVSPAIDIEGIENLNEVADRFIQALAEYPIYGIKDVENMTIHIEATENTNDLYHGRYKSIQIKADSVISNGVRLHDFELIFEGVQVNLYDLFLNGKLILFELNRIFPRGTIRFEQLEELAVKAMKSQGRIWLEGHKDRLILQVNYSLPQGGNMKGKAIVRVDFEPGQSIRPVLESLNIGPLSIPKAFYRQKSNIVINLKPTVGWPLNTDIRSFKVFPRRLEINQYKN